MFLDLSIVKFFKSYNDISKALKKSYGSQHRRAIYQAGFFISVYILLGQYSQAPRRLELFFKAQLQRSPWKMEQKH